MPVRTPEETQNLIRSLYTDLGRLTLRFKQLGLVGPDWAEKGMQEIANYNMGHDNDIAKAARLVEPLPEEEV